MTRPSDTSPFRFPWHEVQAKLDSQSGHHAIHHYPFGGTRSSRSLGAQAERIDAGTSSKPQRETCSFIYHCKAGNGSTRIKGSNVQETPLLWAQSDTFAVPAWSEVCHSCTGEEDAYLFAINDRPVVEALGFYRNKQ